MVTEDAAWLLMEAVRLLNKPTRGLSMLELGDQLTGWNLRVTTKAIMEWLGVKHTSIDLNGQNGALPLDLSKPLNTLQGEFDVVTNYGTTEHVCSTGDLRDQWQAFKNIHDCSKPDSVLIHVIPDLNGAHWGCGYVYDNKFFFALAAACDYRLHHLYTSKSDTNHWAALFIRHPNSIFPSFEDFCAMGGIHKAPPTAPTY
jgi:hypothetical protein